MVPLGTAPHSVTLPSCAVTSIAPEGSLASGASSACFTLAASSLFGSGFGGSGFTSGLGSGFGDLAAFATGLRRRRRRLRAGRDETERQAQHDDTFHVFPLSASVGRFK